MFVLYGTHAFAHTPSEACFSQRSQISRGSSTVGAFDDLHTSLKKKRKEGKSSPSSKYSKVKYNVAEGFPWNVEFRSNTMQFRQSCRPVYHVLVSNLRSIKTFRGRAVFPAPVLDAKRVRLPNLKLPLIALGCSGQTPTMSSHVSRRLDEGRLFRTYA